jgi:hypothetical protein
MFGKVTEFMCNTLPGFPRLLKKMCFPAASSHRSGTVHVVPTGRHAGERLAHPSCPVTDQTVPRIANLEQRLWAGCLCHPRRANVT